MADPTPYVRGYSFSGFQASDPTTPLPAPHVDDELDKIKISIGRLVEAVKDVRRPDGRVVGVDDISGQVTFQQDGTGSVVRPLASKLKDALVSVKDFGAIGDGAANDAAAVQAAVDYALTLPHGATIRVPAGTYKIATQVLIPKTANKFVTFDCDTGTVFMADGALGAAMFYVGSHTVPGGGSNFTCINGVFEGQNTTNTRAFKLENANDAVFRDNVFRSLYFPVEMIASYSVEFDGNMFDTNTVYSIYSSTSAHHLFLHGNRFYNTGTSGTYTILLDGATDNLIVRDNDAETGWTFLGMGAGGSALTIEGNYIEFFSNTPWFFTSAVRGVSIRQNWVALSGTLALGNITGGSYVNNSSFNQTITVNTGTVSDLAWSGNSLTGTGTLAYAGSVIVGSQNLSSGSSYKINDTIVLSLTGSRPQIPDPDLTGVPKAPTAAADTNTTQVATAAFVIGQAAAATPAMDGAAGVGTSLRFARADHVHPSDTSRAPVADPTFTGVATTPKLVVSTTSTPASAAATGTAGEIRWDSGFIYVCTATNTWKRAAIATW